MIQAIEAIHQRQLNDRGNGEYTVTYPAGSATVLSCNPPDGQFTLSTNDGPYERCRIVGGSLVFAPPWNGPLKAYIVPYVSELPNG